MNWNFFTLIIVGLLSSIESFAPEQVNEITLDGVALHLLTDEKRSEINKAFTAIQMGDHPKFDHVVGHYGCSYGDEERDSLFRMKSDSATMLHHAAYWGKGNFVNNLLIEQDSKGFGSDGIININAENKQGLTPLDFCMKGFAIDKTKIAKLLIKNGAISNRYKRTDRESHQAYQERLFSAYNGIGCVIRSIVINKLITVKKYHPQRLW
jgi:hypothetical protein